MRSTGWCWFDLLVHIFGEMGSTKTYHLCTWTRNRRFQQCRFMMVYESWAWAFEDVRNARLAFTWHLLLGYLRCSWHLLSAGMFFVEDTIVGYRWPELVVTFCIISIASLVTQTLTWPTMPNLTCIQSQSELPSERNLLDLQSLSSTTSRVLSPDGRWRMLEACILKYSEVISVCDYVDFHSWYLLAWKFEFRSFGGQVLGTGQHISWESELQA